MSSPGRAWRAEVVTPYKKRDTFPILGGHRGSALAVCDMRPDEGIGPYGVLAALAPSDKGGLDGQMISAPASFSQCVYLCGNPLRFVARIM